MHSGNRRERKGERAVRSDSTSARRLHRGQHGLAVTRCAQAEVTHLAALVRTVSRCTTKRLARCALLRQAQNVKRERNGWGTHDQHWPAKGENSCVQYNAVMGHGVRNGVPTRSPGHVRAGSAVWRRAMEWRVASVRAINQMSSVTHTCNGHSHVLESANKTGTQ